MKRCNDRLRKQGRPLLSRYHAADCSNLKNEFEGWTKDEQKEFTSELFAVFPRQKHPVIVQAFSVEMAALSAVFPDIASEERIGHSYALLLRLLLSVLGDNYCRRHTRITLIHERCAHNGVLADAFNASLADPTFKEAVCFATLAPMSWEHCIPLQPTDLIAYENFKDADAKFTGRKRRISYELLLKMNKISGEVRILKEPDLQHLKMLLEQAGTVRKQHPKTTEPEVVYVPNKNK
ncbi:MAG: hypothetical protein AB7O65_06630 [Candidatus Korobacteraceae bacterium]